MSFFHGDFQRPSPCRSHWHLSIGFSVPFIFFLLIKYFLNIEETLKPQFTFVLFFFEINVCYKTTNKMRQLKMHSHTPQKNINCGCLQVSSSVSLFAYLSQHGPCGPESFWLTFDCVCQLPISALGPGKPEKEWYWSRVGYGCPLLLAITVYH
jgi:hypothetical protein